MKPTKKTERGFDGDSSGDSSDDEGETKVDSRKKMDTERGARTGPQKKDEQDALGSPDKKVR